MISLRRNPECMDYPLKTRCVSLEYILEDPLLHLAAGGFFAEF